MSKHVSDSGNPVTEDVISPLQAIRYSHGQLEILDQLLLPSTTTYLRITSCSDSWEAINKMKVRGAPAIAIVGCLSLAVELVNEEFVNKQSLSDRITDRLKYLVTARPTAVNLTLEADRILSLTAALLNNESIKHTEMKNKVVDHIEGMLAADLADNKAIGEHGCDHILRLNKSPNYKVKLLTHCNTGSLATAGYGTALGVIRSLHARHRLERAFCTETRPYNQGCRLTAYELIHDGIPSTLVCDSMVAALIKKHTIDAVVVGADRVAANGDTANKIGTYQLAVIAKHHGVPFYVAAPSTSIDLSLTSGELIPIEERPAAEMTHVGGRRIAPERVECWNPAFDVTPAELITGGIVTEKGVFVATDIASIGKH